MAMTHILVHGFAGGAWSWEAVIAKLHLPSIAITLPGHAPTAEDRQPTTDYRRPTTDNRLPKTDYRRPSTDNRTPTSFAEMVAWLRFTVEGLGVPLSEIHLVGYSAGGRLVAGALAAGFAVRCATLISSGFGTLDPGERDERARSDAAWSALLRTQGMPAFLDAWESQPIFASQRGLPAAAHQRECRLQFDPAALADAMDALSAARMPDVLDALKRCTLPLQLVVGGRDAKYLALARSASVGELHIIDEAGHSPLLETPGPLARCLDEFAGYTPAPPSH